MARWRERREMGREGTREEMGKEGERELTSVLLLVRRDHQGEVEGGRGEGCTRERCGASSLRVHKDLLRLCQLQIRLHCCGESQVDIELQQARPAERKDSIGAH